MANNTQFDYVNQAWIVDGIIQACGHDSTDCNCYGRTRAGERHVDLCKLDNCDVCHEVNIGLAVASMPSSVSAIKVTRKVWTKQTIKLWLVECDGKEDCAKTRALVTRALLFMYARQTQDEQSQLATSHTNGIGFTGVDAFFLSSVAEKCIKYGNDISPKQFIYVRKKLVKYSGQLEEFANTI